MSISKNHHYLPEFYLKGFVNETGRFSIFNCINNRLEYNSFYPSQYFYIKHRNIGILNQL